MLYQPSTKMWCCDLLLALEARILVEIRTNPQSFHGKENSFVVRRPSYDKIMEILFLQDVTWLTPVLPRKVTVPQEEIIES